MSKTLENALARLDQLGLISDSPSHLVRTFLSPANLLAAKEVAGWMTGLGMEISHAADGTVRGILPGSDPAAKPLLLGSHIDTVIDAGKYDGPLGIIAALAALENLQQENITLPFPIHLLAFSDEEGTRFQTTYLGSRSITGPLDSTTLATRDANGVTIAAAIEDHGWNVGSTIIRYTKGQCRGYVELHIEQGRVLEKAGEPCCVVSAIAGQSRLTVKLNGRADHAGTTPMPMRRDALTGAAECILAAESLARTHPPLVITVGKIQIHPGASNSVPQSVSFTIDLRHPEDAARHQALAELQETFNQIANGRSLRFDWIPVQDNDATPCDPDLTHHLMDSLESITGSRRTLASGAGHDGVAISKICPIAMLFIRCRDGLSHHPEELASPEDIRISIEILTHFLKSLAS
ncbi:MAG: M20 family metallo-hydrolase [Luteolibacter sp.]|uniref:M20 family metallo-hydrolase n=1 Tax=Luteolibacter sp. TaxID=1962973 RepID=UPI003264E4D7